MNCCWTIQTNLYILSHLPSIDICGFSFLLNLESGRIHVFVPFIYGITLSTVVPAYWFQFCHKLSLEALLIETRSIARAVGSTSGEILELVLFGFLLEQLMETHV